VCYANNNQAPSGAPREEKSERESKKRLSGRFYFLTIEAELREREKKRVEI
jgi:hypothetical protein